ncbi:MAG: hypothetical protein KC492_13615 [Myxococcales bacterium]|nr:hypothetical protein [Myxococcales bacterium]
MTEFVQEWRDSNGMLRRQDITDAVLELVEAARDNDDGQCDYYRDFPCDASDPECPPCRMRAALAKLREGEETPVERGIQRRQIGRASRSRPNESEETKP